MKKDKAQYSKMTKSKDKMLRKLQQNQYNAIQEHIKKLINYRDTLNSPDQKELVNKEILQLNKAQIAIEYKRIILGQEPLTA